MPTATGTSTDYHDLLDDLRNFLVSSCGWTQIVWTAPGSITAEAVLCIRPPGAGAGRRPFCWFRSRNSVGSGFYGWLMNISSDYSGSLAIVDNLEFSPDAFFNTSNTTITYWFYANDRRVIVIAKVGTTYSSLYSGMFLPFALPSEYERPFYLHGHYDSLASPNLVDSKNSFIASPGESAAYLGPENIWKKVRNRTANASDVTGGTDMVNACLWPDKTPNSAFGSNNYDIIFWTNTRPNINNEHIMIQCQIVDPQRASNVGQILGGLDGVYRTPGFGRSPEQTATLGGRTFRLFPNQFRTATRDYMSIEAI